ncbi:MAG: hypothetical protein ACLFQR_13480, partial [Desulfovibrionales bacterium]
MTELTHTCSLFLHMKFKVIAFGLYQILMSFSTKSAHLRHHIRSKVTTLRKHPFSFAARWVVLSPYVSSLCNTVCPGWNSPNLPFQRVLEYLPAYRITLQENSMSATSPPEAVFRHAFTVPESALDENGH